MNEWPKLVVILFELIITSILIALIALLVSMGQSAGEKEQAKVDSITEMKEYREYNKWDNNNRVYYQDIIELILLHQNSTVFVVKKLDGYYYYSNTNTHSSYFTRDTLQNEIYEPSVQYYEAKLLRDAYDNGKIVGYTFTAR